MRRLIVVTAVMIACALAARVTLAAPVVVPGGGTVAGKTIGEYTADWWNWAGSIPTNAFTDTTGAEATKNQSGPVFFVAGTQGAAPVTRNFEIPAGKFVLFPLLNFIVANGPDPGFADTQTEADALVTSAFDPAKLIANVDGMDIPDLASHREKSQLNFTWVSVAGSNTFPPGTYTDANSDGYWIMLEPLAAGAHTLHFGGTSNDFVGPDPAVHVPSFTVDVTDNVNVPGSTAIPLPPAMLSALPLLGVAWGAMQGRRRLAR